MDPNATLADLRATLADLAEGRFAEGTGEHAETVANAIEFASALDEWLSKGGFLPDAWQAGR